MSGSIAGVTAYIADFVASLRFEAVPAEVMDLGKKSILDALGPALAGSASETSGILQRYLRGLGVCGRATVLGTGLRIGARFAALANGTSMHADDYDDTLQAATGKFEGIHPTAPVLSALLADAETSEGVDRSGRALLTAFHAGAETSCKIFDATAAAHIVNGFHSTGSVSVLGATMAVGHLRRADMPRLQTMLGMAASQASGLSENFGTMVKPFHAGRSAETALMVADLVADGFTASRAALESRRGYFQAYGGSWEPERILGRLGQPWSFVDRGVSLKAWPTGSLSHPAMTLFLDLVQTNDVRPENVVRITLRTSENIHSALKHHRPWTELEGKFSLEFCIASVVLNRRLGLRDFHDAYVQQDAIQRLIKLVDYTTFSEAEARAAGYGIVTTLGGIELADGRVLSARRDYGKGAKIDPMTLAEVEAKFMDCAAFAKWPAAKARQAINLVNGLEAVSDIRALTACFAAS